MAHPGKFSGGADRFGEIFDSQGKIQSQYLPAGGAGQGFNYRGPWQANTPYVAYDVVTYAGSAWIATTSFTSGATFNAANWTVWSSAGNAELAFAQVTANVLVTDTTATDTGLQIVVTSTGLPYYVDSKGLVTGSKGTATAGVVFGLSLKLIDVTNAGAQLDQANITGSVPSTSTFGGTIITRARISDAAGVQRTFKTQVQAYIFPTGATNVGLQALSTFPATLRAMQA
jgi:hypothetical protein